MVAILQTASELELSTTMIESMAIIPENLIKRKTFCCDFYCIVISTRKLLYFENYLLQLIRNS